jgi:NitT/TauT family transport system substrate-binding protein
MGRSSRAWAEARPEVTHIRLAQSAAICFAPIFVAGDGLLQAEGFPEVEYVTKRDTEGHVLGAHAVLASGAADIGASDVGSILFELDQGRPLVVLCGLHSGCYELFGGPGVRAIRDLRGKQVAIPGLHTGRHLMLSAMLANVGLAPGKDVAWVTSPAPQSIQLLADGKVDAYLGFPPEPQQLRARKIGRLVVSMTSDRPWADYFCCMVLARREFVQKNPVATKRALRAILKATEVCTTDRERAARVLVERGLTTERGFTLEMLRELPYARWRSYNPADTMRFFGLRLHEAGLIKASPNRLIVEGTDWRFVNELKKELKG